MKAAILFLIFSVTVTFSIQNLPPTYAQDFDFPHHPNQQHHQPLTDEQVGKCLSSISKLEPCVQEIINSFLSFHFDGVGPACCTAFMDISDDCLAQQGAHYMQNPWLKQHCSLTIPPSRPSPTPTPPSKSPSPPSSTPTPPSKSPSPPSSTPTPPSKSPSPPSTTPSSLCSSTPPPGDQPFPREPLEALPLPEVDGSAYGGGCWSAEGRKSKIWNNAVSSLVCEIKRTKGVSCDTFKPFEEITEVCCVGYKDSWHLQNCKTGCDWNIKPRYVIG